MEGRSEGRTGDVSFMEKHLQQRTGRTRRAKYSRMPENFDENRRSSSAGTLGRMPSLGPSCAVQHSSKRTADRAVNCQFHNTDSAKDTAGHTSNLATFS